MHFFPSFSASIALHCRRCCWELHLIPDNRSGSGFAFFCFFFLEATHTTTQPASTIVIFWPCETTTTERRKNPIHSRDIPSCCFFVLLLLSRSSRWPCIVSALHPPFLPSSLFCRAGRTRSGSGCISSRAFAHDFFWFSGSAVHRELLFLRQDTWLWFFSIYLFFAIWNSPNRPNGELHGDLTLLPEHISSASGILPLLMPR